MLLKNIIADTGRQGHKEQREMITFRKGGEVVQESYMRSAFLVLSSLENQLRKKKLKKCTFL